MNDRLIKIVAAEPDGEGWFECRICGLHVGFDDIEVARDAAERHDTSDCVEELEAAI